MPLSEVGVRALHGGKEDVFIAHDVLRLDVAMNQAGPVDGCERMTDVDANGPHVPFRQRASRRKLRLCISGKRRCSEAGGAPTDVREWA